MGVCVVEDDGEWRESVGVVVESGFVVAISDDGNPRISSLLFYGDEIREKQIDRWCCEDKVLRR